MRCSVGVVVSVYQQVRAAIATSHAAADAAGSAAAALLTMHRTYNAGSQALMHSSRCRHLLRYYNVSENTTRTGQLFTVDDIES